MKFTLTVAWDKISHTREHVVADFIKTTPIKGFRQGKAPANLVEAKVGAKVIFESILDHLLPKVYADEIHQRALKPLTRPKIIPTKIDTGKDWEFEVEIAEKPPVILGDYQKYVKAALKKQAAFKPDPKAKPQPDDDPKLVAIFDALLANAKCEVPAMLIEEETNNQLSRLITQLKKLGLSLDSYLQSIKSTAENLRRSYETTAVNNLKLEFILDTLIINRQIKIEEKAIDDLIDSLGDEQAKKQLQTNREREGIRYMLAKRQLVEQLKQL